MELRHLRYFVAAAEELHFTRAAARVGINQAPFSQQIKQLENQIGTSLFSRESRRVTLTAAGAAFLQSAYEILKLCDRAMVGALQIGRGEKGILRVAFTSSASFNPLVTNSLSEFRASHPSIALALEERNTTHLLRLLQEGNLDIAFLRPAAGELNNITKLLDVSEEMRVALPSSHKLANRSAVRLSELSDDPFIMFPRRDGRGMYDAIVSACQDSGFNPRVEQEAPQMASTVNLVAASIGVAIVPLSMSSLQTQRVSYKPIKGLAPKAYLTLAMRSGQESPAMTNFVEIVRRLAGAARSRRRGSRI